jgi:hypothetical protein
MPALHLPVGGGGHEDLDAQRVQGGKLHHGAILDAFAGIQITVDDDTGEGADQAALGELGARHIVFAVPGTFLFACLRQALLGDIGLGPDLVHGLVGDEVLLHQALAARQTLFVEVTVGDGRLHIRLGLGAALRDIGGGALDIGLERRHYLAHAYVGASVDMHLLQDADDRAAEFHYPIRFDQTTERLRRARRCGRSDGARQQGETQCSGQGCSGHRLPAADPDSTLGSWDVYLSHHHGALWVVWLSATGTRHHRLSAKNLRMASGGTGWL